MSNAVDCWQVFGAICIERKLDIGTLSLVALGTFGLVSIYLAYRQLKLTRRAQQTQSAIQLFHEFMDDKDQLEFLYRLDYANNPRAWRFDPNYFPNSKEEMLLDHLLYQLSFIGSLLESRDLTNADLTWIKPKVGIVLNNNNVLDYLEWLKSPNQIPNHAGFVGAIKLYRAPFGNTTPQFERLRRYLEHQESSP